MGRREKRANGIMDTDKKSEHAGSVLENGNGKRPEQEGSDALGLKSKVAGGVILLGVGMRVLYALSRVNWGNSPAVSSPPVIEQDPRIANQQFTIPDTPENRKKIEEMEKNPALNKVFRFERVRVPKQAATLPSGAPATMQTARPGDK